MEDELGRIRAWASHGTIRQFYSEVISKVSGEGYQVEVEGNTLTCFKTRKQGGFLGIGRRTIKESVLQVVREGDVVTIPEESADEEFVKLLASKLSQH